MRRRPLNGHVDWLDDVQPQQRNTVCKTMSKRTKTSLGKEVIILDSSASSSEDEGSIENRRHGRQAANKAACKGLAKKEARPRLSKGSKPGSKQVQVRYGGAFLWSLWTFHSACLQLSRQRANCSALLPASRNRRCGSSSRLQCHSPHCHSPPAHSLATAHPSISISSNSSSAPSCSRHLPNRRSGSSHLRCSFCQAPVTMRLSTILGPSSCHCQLQASRQRSVRVLCYGRCSHSGQTALQRAAAVPPQLQL